MDGPLWTERHAPSIAELPQPEARKRFEGAIEEPMNLLVNGPVGAGKTAAVRAYAEEIHQNPDTDLIEINVADVFGMTKKEIRNDPRFGPFLEGETEFSKQYRSGSKENQYKREWSKRDMLSHIVKEMAGYTPSSGSFKTVLLDNAEDMREDFQQSLRRIMEQHHEGTQFVIATRQPSALIPPIRSRCFPIVMRAPTHAETVAVLERIVDAENEAAEDPFEYDDDGLEYVAGYADGDLRSAILGAQTTAERESEITMQAAYEALDAVEGKGQVEDMVDAAVAGEFTDARSTLDDLLVDEGHAGTDVLADVLAVVRSRWSGDRVAEVHRLAGEIDADLHEGTNERLHVSHLLAELGELDERSG